MNQTARRCLLALSALAAAPGLATLVRAMPEFGSGPRALGQEIAVAGPGLRRVQNLVSAVNFDFRSLDTIGEEFMLMCAVTGTVLLLRGGRGERATDRPALTPGRQRGYLLYFSSAKQSETRAARVEKCMPRILKGKGLDD